MKWKDFIKEKLIGIFLIIFALITIEIFLMAYPYGNFIKIYIPLTILLLYFIGLIIEYTNKNNFYTDLSNTLNDLDEKYLITEIINSPNFIEGKILKNSLEQIDKSIELTRNEFKILKYLVTNREKIVSREDIMECLWDSESFIDDNTLTVNITRLRNKLEELGLKELLETKRGQGYILKRRDN